MSEIAAAYVSLLPSARGFGSSTEKQIGPQLSGVASRTGKKFGGIFARSSLGPLRAIGVAAAGLFAVDKLKDFTKDSIAEARESQKVNAITAQTIKSTGSAANVTAKQVGNLTTAISNKTGIDDEAIQVGANQLLTFTKIGNQVGKNNDIFNQATQAAVDLSAHGFGDIASASVQLGKALNDPIKGITALNRSGVTFTEQQQAQIKTLVASGKSLQAQKIILKAVQQQVGGTAAAAATNGEKLDTIYRNFEEAIGGLLLPALDKVEAALGRLLLNLTNKINPAFATLKKRTQPIATAFKTVSGVVDSFIKNHLKPAETFLSGIGGATFLSFAILIGSTLVDAVGLLASVLASPVVVIGFLAGAAIYAYKNFAGFRDVVNELAQSFVTNVLPVLKQFGTFLLTVVLPAVVSFARSVGSTVGPILSQIGGIITGQVLPILRSFAGFFVSTIIPTIAKVAASIGQSLKPTFDQLVATFRGSVLPTIAKLLVKFHEAQPTIQKVVGVVIKLYAKFIEFYFAVLGKVLPVVIKFIGVLIGKVIPAIINVIAAVVKVIAKIVEFEVKVQSVAVKVVGYFAQIPAKIGSLAGKFVAAGKHLVTSIFNGLVSAAKSAGGFVASLASAIKNAINSALHLPLQVSFDKGPIHIHATVIPAFANGVDNFSGGLALVGEKGPELVTLPRGSSVTSNAALRRATGSKGALVPSVLGTIGDGSQTASAITKISKRIDDLIGKVGKKAPAALKELAKSAKSTAATANALVASFQTISSAAKDLASSVAGAFKPDLFSGTIADFFTNGLTSVTSLKALRGALAKIRGTLGGGKQAAKFISDLFASGNTGLILSLAGSTPATIKQAEGIYNQTNALSGALGAAVSTNEFGAGIDKLDKRLQSIEKTLRDVGPDLGREINAAAKAAKRKAAAKHHKPGNKAA